MHNLIAKINFIRQRKPLKIMSIGLVFLVVIFGVFLVFRPAFSAITSILTENFGFWLANNILLPIASFLGKLLVMILNLLIAIIQYNDFVNNPAVQNGWSIVRDVCNMFFIIVLLVIAFGTVFNIQRYKYNQLLGKLVMMIILINFSKMIAGFFIDLSQVVMMTFVNGFRDAAAANFATSMGLREMLEFRDAKQDPPQDWEAIGIGLLAIAMLVVALIVIIAMFVVFLMRIIMLWILVVLSPLAYLLNVLPGKAAGYAGKWWESFGKYCTVGPVMAFFIWLAFVVTSSWTTAPETGEKKSLTEDILKVTVNQKDQPGLAKNTDVSDLSATISKAGTSNNILSFIISISMLVGALMVAQQAGGVAGQFAGAAMGKVKGMGMGALKAGLAPLKGATALGGYGVRQLYRHTGLQLDPRHWAEGIKANFARRKAQDLAAGSVKAGEALMKGGGVGKMIKGFTGATEDFSDYYFRGFLGVKGWAGERDKKTGKMRAGRMWRAMTGGEEKVTEIRNEIQAADEAIKKRKDALMLAVTKEEKPGLMEEAVMKQAEAERMAKAQRENKYDYRDVEHFRSILTNIETELKEMPGKDKMTDEEKVRKDELLAKQKEIKEFVEKIDLFGKFIEHAEDYQKEARLKMGEAMAKAAGETDATKRKQYEDEADRYRSERKTIKDELEDINNLRDKNDIKAIVDSKSILDIKKIFDKEGKKDYADNAYKLHMVYEYKLAQGEALKKMAKEKIEGNDIGAQYFKKDADRLEHKIDGETTKMEIKPEFIADWTDDLRDELLALQEDLDGSKKGTLMYRLKAEPIPDEERKRMEEELKTITDRKNKLEADRIAYRGPQAFRAMQARRSQVMEEMRKLTTTNEDELIMLLENAIRTGNDSEIAAISLHAARVSHWNELLNGIHTPDISQYIDEKTGQYKKETPWGEPINPDHPPVNAEGTYVANQDGTSAFVRDIFIKQAKMAEQDAFSIQNDISNILENVKHWNVGGQSIGSRDGLFYQRPTDEQQSRSIIEMSKTDEEKLLREGNRLAWMSEDWIDPKDHSKGREGKVSSLGIWMLDTKFKTITDALGRGRYSKNTAMNLMTDYNWKVMDEIYRRKSGADREEFRKFTVALRKYAGEAAAEFHKSIGNQVRGYMDEAVSVQKAVRERLESESE